MREITKTFLQNKIIEAIDRYTLSVIDSCGQSSKDYVPYGDTKVALNYISDESIQECTDQAVRNLIDEFKHNSENFVVDILKIDFETDETLYDFIDQNEDFITNFLTNY